MTTTISIIDLSRMTGLSPYLLSVLYDFHSHKFNQAGRRPTQQQQAESFAYWDKLNTGLRSFAGLNQSEIKVIVAKREQELKLQLDSGLLRNSEEKDALLVREFCGWVQTVNGHFLYTYYMGGNRQNPESWAIVHKDHLSLFHSRISGGKDLRSLYSLNSLDILSSCDGHCHIALDVRFVMNRWFNSTENEKWKSLIRDNLDLLRRGEDYLPALLQYKENCLTVSEEYQQTAKESNITVDTLLALKINKI